MKYFVKKNFSGYDCHADDFLSDANKVVLANDSDEDFYRMICFQNAVLVKAKREIYDWSKDFASKYIGFRCIDVYQSAILHGELLKYGYTMSGGQGLLPDITVKRRKPEIDFRMQIFEQNEMANLCGQINPSEWHMCRPSEKTALAVAAYDKDRIIGLSSADSDTDKLWSIDAETLPEYRKKGVAVALTTQITNILLSRGIIPFATGAWSNVAAKTTLYQCGYYPAWSEIASCNIEAYG